MACETGLKPYRWARVPPRRSRLGFTDCKHHAALGAQHARSRSCVRAVCSAVLRSVSRSVRRARSSVHLSSTGAHPCLPHISVASCFHVGPPPGPPARARPALTALGATRCAPWLHAPPPLHVLVHGLLPQPAPQSSSIASRAAFAAAVASASIAGGTS